MKTTLDLRAPYRRNDGHIGAHARMKVEHPDGWVETYAFDTHGMTSQQVVDEAAAIAEHHAKKATRLTGFRSIQGMEIAAGGQVYRIVDCTIFERDIALYLDVRPRAPGFPTRKVYGNLDAVPSDEEIVAMVTAALPNSTDEIQQAHDAFVAKVKAKRG